MYKLTNTSDFVVRLSDQAWVNTAFDNPDYQEYLRWRDGWTEELWEMQLQDVEKTIEHPEVITPAWTDEEGIEHPEVITPAWTETITVQEYVRVVTGTVDHPPHTPEPADPIVIPPITVVSMRQARLQLLLMPFGDGSLLDAVNASVSGLSQAAQIEWEYAAEVKRDNPLFLEIANSLGFTEEQIDDFFNEAVLR